ncbi:MAG: anaerobic ribonucleoside-triphosphate reductase [Bacilli bacterium]
MEIYNFPMTLDRQFKNQLEYLHDKYGDNMLEIEGMSPLQLDTCKFFKNFMETDVVADATIDDNANVTSKNIITMLNEANKPFLKLLSRNKLYIELREEFGIDVANEFLESAINGEIYEHDSILSSYQPYCFSFSLKPIVEKGLYFIEEMKANPAQHWDTFNHHVLEFVSYATNQTAK